MNQLLEKLKRAEEQVRSVLARFDKYKSFEKVGREDLVGIREALRSSALLIQEASEDPEVERFGYSKEIDPHSHRKHGLMETHESYGVVSVTKPTGRMRLVGSMVDSLPTCVDLHVHRSKRVIDRDLNTEHWYADNRMPLLSIRLSTYQWAELLSSFNGVSIPCTLQYILGVRMDPPPEEAKTPLEQISDDAMQTARTAEGTAEDGFLEAVRDLIKMVNTLKISKVRTQEITDALNKLAAKFIHVPKANAAWATKRLAEESEKVVSQARVEIAAAVTTLLQVSGLEALQEKLGLSAQDIAPQLKGKSE